MESNERICLISVEIQSAELMGHMRKPKLQGHGDSEEELRGFQGP